MTIHYDPVDDITYFVMLGDTCRYSLIPDGVTTAAYLESVPDDSGWTTGPQPLIQPGVTPDAVIPPPHFGMNDPFAYTIATLSSPPPVAQVHFSVPSQIAAQLTVDTRWGLGVWVGGNCAVWLDGVSVYSNTGSNFETAQFTFAQNAALTAGGSFVLGLVGGNINENWGFGATVFLQGKIGANRLPPLRQFPRDDALGGAPRQGHQSQSIQGSARQGWLGAYR